MNTTSQANAPPRTNVAGLLEEVSRREGDLTAYLPEGISSERFMALARRAITEQPKIAECRADSVLKALRECAMSGLELDGHSSSLIVHRSKDGAPTVRWDASSHGMTQVAMDNGHVRSVDSQAVRKHDTFSYEAGDAPRLHHVPLLIGARGPVIASYAVAKLADGSKLIEVLLGEDLTRIRGMSPSADRGPWSIWPDEMARKSAIRRLLKRLPHSSTRRTGRLPDDSPGVIGAPTMSTPTRELPPEDQHAAECHALAQLSDATNISELDAAWTAAQLTFRQLGADVPLTVEARWHELRETLAGMS